MMDPVDEIRISQCVEILSGRPALLLDRDGVVVEEVNYLHRIEDVSLMSGIADLINDARKIGAVIIVITNQSGLARGLFDWKAYHAIEKEIDRRLAYLGCSIDVTVACPFHPDFTSGYGPTHAHLRKPGPGMIELAASRFGVNLSGSILVGDNVSDIEAARRAGLPMAAHVLTGHGHKYRHKVVALDSPDFDVVLADDLHDLRRQLIDKWPLKLN